MDSKTLAVLLFEISLSKDGVDNLQEVEEFYIKSWNDESIEVKFDFKNPLNMR